MEGNANRLRISNLQSKEPHQTGDGDDADGDDGGEIQTNCISNLQKNLTEITYNRFMNISRNYSQESFLRLSCFSLGPRCC